MKSLILVAVILQLVIIGIKTDGKYQFGDIIEFPRKCGTYSHYAIYVGPESVENVGQGENDIFHRRGKGEDQYICEFGKLAEERKGSDDKEKNYLEGKHPAGNEDEIKERIKQKNNECGRYTYFTNNCEHLATYVRYGIGHSKQKGRLAQCVFTPLDKIQELIHDIWKNSDDNNNASC